MGIPLTRKIKITFSLKEIGDFSIEESSEVAYEKMIFHKFDTSDSINKFATALIHFKYLPEHNELTKLSINDYITLFVSFDDEPYKKNFSGIITNLGVFKTDIGTMRFANLISPFSLLEKVKIKADSFKDCVNLNQILEKFIQISGIKCDLVIEEDAKSNLQINNEEEVLASTFLRNFLSKNNLIPRFDIDGTLHIYNSETYDEKMYRPDWTITDKDLESGEITNLKIERIQ
jgi:hypothetical protein